MSFSNLVISSSLSQPSMISVRRSVLFLRQASMSCSFFEAPYTTPRVSILPPREPSPLEIVRVRGGGIEKNRGRDPTNLRLVSCHSRNARSDADLYFGVATRDLWGRLHRERKSVLDGRFEGFTRAQVQPYFAWAGTGSFGLVGRVAGGGSERDMEL